MDRPLYYRLEGKIPVPSEEMGFSYSGPTTVAKTYIGDGEVAVSTVFLELDHNHSMTGPPVLFETMVFGGPCDEYQDRYCTWDEAEQGHEAVVLMCREAEYAARGKGWRDGP